MTLTVDEAVEIAKSISPTWVLICDGVRVQWDDTKGEPIFEHKAWVVTTKQQAKLDNREH